MPSHRQGNIPKHRAGRPNENSGRRSRLNAAKQAKRIAPGFSPDPSGAGTGPASPEPPTRPLPQLRSHPGPPPGTRAGPAPRRMRGLLVTPWFAAGAGFVVAAAMALNAPRTFLTYRPNDSPSTSRCVACQSPGSVASKPGVKIRPVNPAAAAGRSAPGPGPAIPIQLDPERNGVFKLTITLPPHQAASAWKLRFALPGRSISAVFGAQWLPDPADDSGQAARLIEGGYVSPSNPAAVSFLVTATGVAIAPRGCVLNGQRCHFVVS
jgi:hypothetical protein